MYESDQQHKETRVRSNKDEVKYILIVNWYNAKEAYELCSKHDADNIQVNLSSLYSRLDVLAVALEPAMLAEPNGEQLYNHIQSLLKPDNHSSLCSAFREINKWLYKKGLLKWDDFHPYNRQDIEEANAAHGL